MMVMGFADSLTTMKLIETSSTAESYKSSLSNHETSASTSFPNSSSQCKRVSPVMLFPWSQQFGSYRELPAMTTMTLGSHGTSIFFHDPTSTIHCHAIGHWTDYNIYIYLYISMQGHWWFWYNAVSGCVSGNHCDARIGLNIRVWQGFIESKHLHVDVLPLHCIWANRFRLALQLKEIQIFYQKICLADKPPSKELFNRLSTQWCHIIVHYCRVWVWWGAGNLVLTTNSCRVAEVAGTLVGSLHLYQNIMWGHVYPLYTSSFVIINNDE